MFRWRVGTVHHGSLTRPKWVGDGSYGPAAEDGPMNENEAADLLLRVAYLETVLVRISQMAEREEPRLFASCALDYYLREVKASRD